MENKTMLLQDDSLFLNNSRRDNGTNMDLNEDDSIFDEERYRRQQSKLRELSE